MQPRTASSSLESRRLKPSACTLYAFWWTRLKLSGIAATETANSRKETTSTYPASSSLESRRLKRRHTEKLCCPLARLKLSGIAATETTQRLEWS